MDALTQRIEQLELRARRQRWIMMTMGLALLAIFTMAQSPAGIMATLRTKKLLVYNDKNEIVFVVGSDKDSGKGTWQLIDDNKAIASCFPGKWGGSIQLSQQGETKTGLLLVGDRDGHGSAIVWGDNQSIKWQAP
ncbi:MAG: hypothetical protein GC162_08865 [Planctomycetes bacterium]|nr:hypothetical protein [Planctomycetota bacterium]